jgi:transcriptional regulator with XRE-family HTH domain
MKITETYIAKLKWDSSMATAMRLIRKFRKLSQDKLGERLGITRQSVSQLETCYSPVLSYNEFLRLCSALKVTPQLFFRVVENPQEFGVVENPQEKV